MHSIREVMAAEDLALGYRTLRAVFELFPSLDIESDGKPASIKCLQCTEAPPPRCD